MLAFPVHFYLDHPIYLDQNPETSCHFSTSGSGFSNSIFILRQNMEKSLQVSTSDSGISTSVFM